MKLFEIPIYYRPRSAASEDKFWRAYDYNEVIGWVALEPRKNAIRAEHWLVRQRPTKVLVNKEFMPEGKLFQVSTNGLTDEEVFKKLLSALSEAQEYSHLSKYHFDLEAFANTGAHINWKQLLSSCNA